MCQSYNASATYQSKSYLLDTSAQLRKVAKDGAYRPSLTPIQKKAKAKHITGAYLSQLLDLKSPLHKSYKRTYYCGNIILQEGHKLTTEYCKQRWCLDCNRIRTAKALEAYRQPLSELEDLYFVTLTVPNVTEEDLPSEERSMKKRFTQIRNTAKKRGVIMRGIWKFETTDNPDGTYHPHFHVIIEGLIPSTMLRSEWLRKTNGAIYQAQDVQRADENSVMELFKYMTKFTSNDEDGNPKFNAQRMDVIFQANKGKRTLQPFGIKKAQISPIESENERLHDYLPERTETFVYDPKMKDWTSASNELLAHYEPDEKTNRYLHNIQAPKNATKELPTKHPNNAKRAQSPKGVLPQERTNRFRRNESFMEARN